MALIPATILTGFLGSGKTTLAKIILGLEKPDSGMITGHSPAGNAGNGPVRKKGIQAVFQDPGGSLDPTMRMREIVLEGVVAGKIEKKRSG
jgi:ABC-type dipeptide/oligopeptide/nickel transport system ATPase subunit